MRRSCGRRALCALAFLFASLLGTGPAVCEDAAELYSQWGEGVVKLEMVEVGSGAKNTIGSAFAIDAEGLLVTNFHVIAQAVHESERYEPRWVGSEAAGSEEGGDVEVLAIDLVHDLALVRADGWGTRPVFRVEHLPITKGRRLFSLGYPFDLGRTIVTGTYNGPLENALYERIHFSGSLNSGMSGGPTITEAGAVVGVNVATAGKQVSFVVPSERVLDLLAATDREATPTSTDLLAGAREQLVDHQARYFRDLFGEGTKSQALGSFEVPTRPAPFFKCWGHSHEADENELLSSTDHHCSTEDVLFVSRSHRTGVVRFVHRVLTGPDMGRARFFGALSGRSLARGGLAAEEEDVTSFRCDTEFVEHAGRTWSRVFCARAYLRIEGLYDVVFDLTSVAPEAEALQSSLLMGGVTFDTAVSVARRYLERMGWNGSS